LRKEVPKLAVRRIRFGYGDRIAAGL